MESLYAQGAKEPVASVQTTSVFEYVVEIPEFPNSFLALENCDGEEKGQLFIISKIKASEITTDKKSSDQLTLKFLGTVSIASTLTPLKSSLVFIGMITNSFVTYKITILLI